MAAMMSTVLHMQRACDVIGSLYAIYVHYTVVLELVYIISSIPAAAF